MIRRLTPAEAGSRASGIADARLIMRAMVGAVQVTDDSQALNDAFREADTKLYRMEVDALRSPAEPPMSDKPTIPLRIRVGVTADGKWLAMGSNVPSVVGEPDEAWDGAVSDAIGSEGHGPVVAWHWITAEVPMPEVEQGETRGEVEHG